MATSSSDESCTAPKDFHLSSSVDSGSRLSPVHHKCLLCNKPKKRFYCKSCVQNGDFGNESPELSERFSDKQAQLFQSLSTIQTIENDCYKYFEKKKQIDNVNIQIRKHTENIRLLKLLLQEAKDKQTKNNTRLKFLRDEIKTSKVRLPKYDDRCEKLERFVEHKAEQVEEKRHLLMMEREKLKKIAKTRIFQLVQYIFPISQLEPIKSEPVEIDTVSSALAEATRTSYIHGRWILTDSSNELQHSIVAPTLPGSGDYSAYTVWMTEINRVGVPHNTTNVNTEHHNPANSITAALTYTAQLVALLAWYLDIRLPHKLNYGDFSARDMSEKQFTRRVAKLNANVLHLCLSQSVLPDAPGRTLYNVLNLLRSPHLGRIGPVEVTIENRLLSEIEPGEDSDSEEGDVISQGWEAVPHVVYPDPTPAHMTETATAQQTTSIAGLYTSLASIWRGWTGAK